VILWVSNSCKHCITFTLLLGTHLELQLRLELIPCHADFIILYQK
jgi:hypothetical protein